MAAVTLSVDDLVPLGITDPATAQVRIDDALARAALIAPCITSDDFPEASAAAARAIIRAAIARQHQAGTGAFQGVQTGPFGVTVDTRGPAGALFTRDEVRDLRSLCRGVGGAFSIDTTAGAGGGHAQICARVFGADWCSCGAELTGGLPLWEGP